MEEISGKTNVLNKTVKSVRRIRPSMVQNTFQDAAASSYNALPSDNRLI